MAYEALVEGSSASSRTVGDFHAMQQPVVFTLHYSQGFRHATSNPPLPPSVCDPYHSLDAPTTTSLSSPTSSLRHDEHPEWDVLSSGSSSPGFGPSAYHAGVHSSHIGANNLRYRRGDELGSIRIGGERMRAIASHSEVRVRPALALGTIQISRILESSSSHVYHTDPIGSTIPCHALGPFCAGVSPKFLRRPVMESFHHYA